MGAEILNNIIHNYQKKDELLSQQYNPSFKHINFHSKASDDLH
jgi:hypothetical protein